MSFFYKPWASLLLGALCYVLGGLLTLFTSGPPEKFEFQLWLHPLCILFASVPFLLLRNSNLKRQHPESFNGFGQILLLIVGIGAYSYLFTCLDQDPLSVFGFVMFPLYLSVVGLIIFLITRVFSPSQE